MSRRRTFKLVAASAAVAAVIAGSAALAQSTRYDDVPRSHYAYDAVQWATQHRITWGCDDNRFCAEDPMNRSHAVVFLNRYHNNVVNSELARLRDRVAALERTGPVTTTTLGGGFGEPDDEEEAPPRKFIARGTQSISSRSMTLPAGTYHAKFTVLAVEAAAAHDDSTTVAEDQAIEEIRVEYRSSVHPDWTTIAVADLKLTGTDLPGDDLLKFATQSRIEALPGTLSNLPTSGTLRVSAYTEAYDPDGADGPKLSERQRTTKYKFSWDVVFTEIKD